MERVLIKNGHTYIFKYQEGEEVIVARILISKALDPFCALDWFDIVVTSFGLGNVARLFIKEKMKELGVSEKTLTYGD